MGGEALAHALGRVAGGDRQALEAIYRATSTKLLGVCVRILKDRNESEDVLQDVYMTVWRRAGAFDPQRGGAVSWLCAVARNRAIDRLRARRPIDGSVQVDDIEVADESPSAFARLQSSDEERRLFGCLDSLDGPAQSVIRTAFMDGVTYETLATRMGAPLGTVKSWVRRGLLKLRACLES